MKTSECILPTALKTSFLFIVTISFMFAGCRDEYRTIIGTSSSNHSLEGTWMAIDIDGNIDENNVLVLMGSSGYHKVNSEVSNTDKLYVEFLYKKISTSMLRITMIQHRVNGVNHPLRNQEDVYFQIDNESLSIFNQRFVREAIESGS